MNCSKCNKEVSEDGNCVGCSLPQEECTCQVVEKTQETGTSEEIQPSKKSAEKKTV